MNLVAKVFFNWTQTYVWNCLCHSEMGCIKGSRNHTAGKRAIDMRNRDIMVLTQRSRYEDTVFQKLVTFACFNLFFKFTLLSHCSHCFTIPIYNLFGIPFLNRGNNHFFAIIFRKSLLIHTFLQSVFAIAFVRFPKVIEQVILKGV